MRIVIEIDGLPAMPGTVTTSTSAAGAATVSASSSAGDDAGRGRGGTRRPNDTAGASDGGAAPSLGAFGGGIGPTGGAGPHAAVGSGPGATTDRSAGPAPASLVGPGFESVEQHAEPPAEPGPEGAHDRSGGGVREAGGESAQE